MSTSDKPRHAPYVRQIRMQSSSSQYYVTANPEQRAKGADGYEGNSPRAENGGQSEVPHGPSKVVNFRSRLALAATSLFACITDQVSNLLPPAASGKSRAATGFSL